MNVHEQGARPDRHMVIPRTLLFVTSIDAVGAPVILLLKGAPTKRLWANRYNGLGGHVEAGEDVRSAALRELAEETGITPRTLTLRGVVHIDTGSDAEAGRPGVMVFVFLGEADFVSPHASEEGLAEWIALTRVHELPLVEDLPDLLAHTLAEPFFHAHYTPDANGTLHRHFLTAP